MLTKQELKQAIAIFKQYVRRHPKALFAYGFAVFTMITFFVYVVAPIMTIGQKVLNGEIVNPLTFDQVTGLLLVVTGAVMFLLTYVWVRFLVGVGHIAFEEEEAKAKHTTLGQKGEKECGKQ